MSNIEESQKVKTGKYHYFSRTSRNTNYGDRTLFTLICKGDELVNTNIEFSMFHYPYCCGIDILADFWGAGLPETREQLIEFFDHTKHIWRPNIQFVAVKDSITEEFYDEEEDEYYDKIVGVSEKYNYNNFIETLIEVTDAKLISSFINENSNNQCDVYQFKRSSL